MMGARQSPYIDPLNTNHILDYIINRIFELDISEIYKIFINKKQNDYRRKSKNNITIQQAYDLFLSEGTLKDSSAYQSIFKNYIGPLIGNEFTMDHTKTKSILFRDNITTQNISTSQKQKIFTIYKVILNYCFKNGYTKNFQYEDIHLTMPKKKSEVLELNSLIKIIKQMNDYDHQGLLFTMAGSGLKRGEVVAIKAENIVFNKNYVSVTIHSKYDTARRLEKLKKPIQSNIYHPVVIEFLKEACKITTGYLFKDKRNNPLETNYLSTTLNNYFKKNPQMKRFKMMDLCNAYKQDVRA